eukprot:COSAG06_NODE_16734_length_984_cov_0.800000_1_plen_36_part_10
MYRVMPTAHTPEESVWPPRFRITSGAMKLGVPQNVR